MQKLPPEFTSMCPNENVSNPSFPFPMAAELYWKLVNTFDY